MVAVRCTQTGRQLRTDGDRDIEKGCQKPALQQKTTDDDDYATKAEDSDPLL